MTKYFDPKFNIGSIMTLITMVVGGAIALATISQKISIQTAVIEQRLAAQESRPTPDPATAVRLQALEMAARDLSAEMKSLRTDISRIAR